MIPQLETARLHMRGFVEGDFDTYARWLADAETVKFIGGAPQSRADAWRSLAMMVGHWSLRGYGMWAVVEKSSGALVGRVGLWNPEGWPGVEVGWLVAPEARRKGYAVEAARASIAYGFDHLECARIVSVIHVDNAPSIAVAHALGERYLENTEVRGMTCALYGIDRA